MEAPFQQGVEVAPPEQSWVYIVQCFIAEDCHLPVQITLRETLDTISGHTYVGIHFWSWAVRFGDGQAWGFPVWESYWGTAIHRHADASYHLRMPWLTKACPEENLRCHGGFTV